MHGDQSRLPVHDAVMTVPFVLSATQTWIHSPERWPKVHNQHSGHKFHKSNKTKAILATSCNVAAVCEEKNRLQHPTMVNDVAYHLVKDVHKILHNGTGWIHPDIGKLEVFVDLGNNGEGNRELLVPCSITATDIIDWMTKHSHLQDMSAAIKSLIPLNSQILYSDAETSRKVPDHQKLRTIFTHGKFPTRSGELASVSKNYVNVYLFKQDASGEYERNIRMCLKSNAKYHVCIRKVRSTFRIPATCCQRCHLQEVTSQVYLLRQMCLQRRRCQQAFQWSHVQGAVWSYMFRARQATTPGSTTLSETPTSMGTPASAVSRGNKSQKKRKRRTLDFSEEHREQTTALSNVRRAMYRALNSGVDIGKIMDVTSTWVDDNTQRFGLRLSSICHRSKRGVTDCYLYVIRSSWWWLLFERYMWIYDHRTTRDHRTTSLLSYDDWFERWRCFSSSSNNWILNIQWSSLPPNRVLVVWWSLHLAR